MNFRYHAGSILIAMAVTVSAGAQELGLDQAFEALPAYTMGDDYRGLELIQAEVNRTAGDAAARAMLEPRLLAVLQTESTADAKLFVCRQLYVMGSNQAVPALAALLANADTADEARYALERMETPEAAAVLRAQLSQLHGRDRMGIINSLAARRDADAVATLAPLLTQDDLETAAAAADALGRIRTAPACDVLRNHVDDARDAVRFAAENGLLGCAEQMLVEGDRPAALQIYEHLYAGGRRDPIRVAAFRGLVIARPDDAPALIEAALIAEDQPVADAALELARTVHAESLTVSLANRLPGLDADRKALIISALADRADSRALAAVMDAARRGEEPVRIAALRALGALGDQRAIPPLARAAVSGSSDEAQAAKQSLKALKGEDINRIMITAARAGDAEIATALLAALAERQAADVAPDLVQMAEKGKAAVRVDALHTLGAVAQPKDLDDLVRLVVAAKNDDLQQAALRAVVATATRVTADHEKTAAILSALPDAARSSTRAALIDALGEIGAPSGLQAVRGAAQDPQKDVRTAAVKALAAWPDNQVMDDLAALATSAEEPAWRDAAFEGYVRLLRQDREREATQKVALYRDAMQRASGPAQLRILFAGLAEVNDSSALELVRPYLENPDVSAEARIAYDRIRRSQFGVVASHNSESARLALDNDPRTRWETGTTQAPGQWFEIDLTEPARLKRLVLDTRRSADDYPRAYEVYIAMDPEQWGSPVAVGEGAQGVTEIDLPDVEGRYIRIVQTGSAGGNFWSIYELTVETR